MLLIELGINPAFKINLESYERTDEIGTLISKNAKHTLVFASYYTDMSGQPASEIEYTYYVFDGKKYTERAVGEEEEFIIRCEVY